MTDSLLDGFAGMLEPLSGLEWTLVALCLGSMDWILGLSIAHGRISKDTTLAMAQAGMKDGHSEQSEVFCFCNQQRSAHSGGSSHSDVSLLCMYSLDLASSFTNSLNTMKDLVRIS